MRAQQWGRVVGDHLDRGRASRSRTSSSRTRRAPGSPAFLKTLADRGRGRRRHRQLAPARLPRHRPAPRAARRRPVGPRRVGSAQVLGRPRTSARSRRSSAPTRPVSSPVPPILVDGGAYAGLCRCCATSSCFTWAPGTPTPKRSRRSRPRSARCPAGSPRSGPTGRPRPRRRRRQRRLSRSSADFDDVDGLAASTRTIPSTSGSSPSSSARTWRPHRRPVQRADPGPGSRADSRYPGAHERRPGAHHPERDLGGAPGVRPAVLLVALRRRRAGRPRSCCSASSARPTGSTAASPGASTRAASSARSSIPSPTGCCSSPR